MGIQINELPLVIQSFKSDLLHLKQGLDDKAIAVDDFLETLGLGGKDLSRVGFCVDTGTASDYILNSPEYNYSTLEDGLTVVFSPTNTNVVNPTIDLDDNGSVGTALRDGSQITAGLLAAGGVVTATYDSISDKFIVNLATETYAGELRLATSAEVASGTDTHSAVSPATLKNKLDTEFGNVDNTADTDKPVSTATQLALDLKLDEADYTATDVLDKIKTVDGTGSGLDSDLLDGQEGSYYLNFNNSTNLPDPTITLSGDVTGSGTLTDLGNTTITATVAGVDLGTVALTGEVPVANLPPASTTAAGVVERATQSEGLGGTDTTRYMSPLRTKQLIDQEVPAATDSTAGKVELATDAEAIAGTDTTRAITPAALDAALDNFGAGGGTIDADTLDGLNSSQFLRSDANDTTSGSITVANTSPAYWLSDTDNVSETNAARLINTGGWLYLQANNESKVRISGHSGLDLVEFTVRYAGAWHTVWHEGNDGSGSGLDADLLDGQQGSYYLNTSTSFGGDVSGTYNNIVVTNDSHTHSFSNLTGKTSGIGDYSTDGDIVAGRGSGSIALTINDGKGNSNIAFNHQDGVPDQNGNAFRIETNTDSTSGAYMDFEMLSNVTGGVNTDLTSRFKITETGCEIAGNEVYHAGNDGAGSGLDADLLDGLESSQFARTDVEEVFSNSVGVGGATPANTFDNGKAIALGDGDTGIRQNGDGVLELWANNQRIMLLNTTEITLDKRLDRGVDIQGSFGYVDNPANYSMNFGNGDIVGINSVIFNDTSNSASEGVLFPRGTSNGNASDYSSVRAYNDELLYAPDALGTSYGVYHEGNLPSSTTSVKGVVELATNSEASAGTDTTRAVTPAGVKAYVDANGGGGGGTPETTWYYNEQGAWDVSPSSGSHTCYLALVDATTTMQVLDENALQGTEGQRFTLVVSSYNTSATLLFDSSFMAGPSQDFTLDVLSPDRPTYYYFVSTGAYLLLVDKDVLTGLPYGLQRGDNWYDFGSVKRGDVSGTNTGSGAASAGMSVSGGLVYNSGVMTTIGSGRGDSSVTTGTWTWGALNPAYGPRINYHDAVVKLKDSQEYFIRPQFYDFMYDPVEAASYPTPETLPATAGYLDITIDIGAVNYSSDSLPLGVNPSTTPFSDLFDSVDVYLRGYKDPILTLPVSYFANQQSAVNRRFARVRLYQDIAGRVNFSPDTSSATTHVLPELQAGLDTLEDALLDTSLKAKRLSFKFTY